MWAVQGPESPATVANLPSLYPWAPMALLLWLPYWCDSDWTGDLYCNHIMCIVLAVCGVVVLPYRLECCLPLGSPCCSALCCLPLPGCLAEVLPACGVTF